MTITRRSWRKLLSQRMKKKSTVNLRKRYLLSWNDSISRTSNGRKDEEGRKRVQEFYELPFTSDLIIQLGDYPQSKGSMEPKKKKKKKWLYPISR